METDGEKLLSELVYDILELELLVEVDWSEFVIDHDKEFDEAAELSISDHLTSNDVSKLSISIL